MASNRVIDVGQSDFEEQVIKRSYREPVIVDFWAPWCGPCRMLGPVLEQLANEPNSGFTLAKVNTDQAPSLAGRYDVRGIPAVKAFRDGRVVEGFVGVQPEPVLRQFIARVRQVRPANGQPAAATGQNVRAPSDPAARLSEGLAQLSMGRVCEAEMLLRGLDGHPAKSLHALALFRCRISRSVSPFIDTPTTQATIYQEAGAALNRKEPSAALYHLLAAYNQESEAARPRVREVMEGVFATLGENYPTARQYRALLG